MPVVEGEIDPNGSPGTSGTTDEGQAERPHQLFVRLAFALIGLLGVGFAELLRVGPFQDALVDVGFVGLVIAATLLLTSDRSPANISPALVKDPRTITWRWTILGLGLAGALIVQTWFQAGTAIAGGDIAPPIGTAWIGRVFSTFGWSGNTLGTPTNNQGQLPWAVIEWTTHLLGGSGAVAQRIWFSLLIAAILMSAGALARSLRLSPIAGVVVALVFFFNPMTMSQVGIYDNILTAMVLVPALAAVVIAYGCERIRLWQICAAFVVAAPFVGYIYSNPPLVGMLALTTAFTPLLVWSRFGGACARRAGWGVLIAGVLLVGASAYWIVPALADLSSISTSSLSGLSTWAFTEARSTLANGFWLNATWGWNFSEYYPYAADFGRFPLNLVPPLIPLMAFCGLALRRTSSDLDRGASRLRGLLALGALGVILLSTGTRPPGNLLFDPLYHLPYGWLLQQPGRFLLVAALSFALLAGLLVEQFQKSVVIRTAAVMKLIGRRTLIISTTILTSIVVVIVALVSSFPLWTGAIVPGPRQGFPSEHVKVPKYWAATADYLNSYSAPRGSLLVLPPDDFYAMPYTWYYGNDGFIPNLLNRHVVVASAESYESVSIELLSSVRLEATAIRNHNWNEAGRILGAIGTPIVLVRGDIEHNFQGRAIASPAALAADLSIDPEMKRVHVDGPLSLYEIRSTYRDPATEFATVNTRTPNLSELTLVPRTVLVTSKPRAGHTALYQLPPVANWRLSRNILSTKLKLPIGWSYSVKQTNSLSHQRAKIKLRSTTTVGEESARIQIPVGRSLISNGDFSGGIWGRVENCDNTQPVRSPEYLRATTIAHAAPGGETAMQLSATVDSACESKVLSWRRGPLVLKLSVRSLAGDSPHICIWEVPINRCAAIPPLPSGTGWFDYSVEITPDVGTSSITLFLYAHAVSVGNPSIEQYAGLTVNAVESAPRFVVVGVPLTSSAPGRIFTFDTGYSSQWIGPKGTTHVVVDGMRNGWITSSRVTGPIVPYDLATQSEPIDEILLALAMTLFAAALWWTRRTRSDRSLSTPPPDTD